MNMTNNIAKSFLSFVIFASVANISNADEIQNREIQERIDRLKAENELLELQKKNAALKELDGLQKENELLELKRKNAALKRGESISESSDFGSTNSAHSTTPKTNRPCTQGKLGKYAPTGCFVGVEVGVAFGVDNTIWGTSGFPRAPRDSSGVSLPITINGGFQWYFLANMGVRVRGNLGYSAHFADMSYGGIDSINATNHSLHYGVEVSYLYDFIATTKRTFGADVGFGIEGMTLFGSSAQDSYDGAYNKTISKFNFWQGRIGVHYYHNLAHQFWLSYMYKPYSSKWVEKAHDTTPNNFIALGYAYRF